MEFKDFDAVRVHLAYLAGLARKGYRIQDLGIFKVIVDPNMPEDVAYFVNEKGIQGVIRNLGKEYNINIDDYLPKRNVLSEWRI